MTQVPSAAELAAIAAAYAMVVRREDDGPPPEMSRWRIAGRLPALDAPRARLAARSGSRWTAAGRLDG